MMGNLIAPRRRMEVLAIAGSLRRDSFNHRALREAEAHRPADLTFDLFGDLASVPLFNEDLESGGGPESVVRLRALVAKADGLLISTPEYSQSVPGVVKNMVDWLSRGDPSVLEGKPIALMGVTTGAWGTRFAQAALRHTLTACGAMIMPTPQLYLCAAETLFEADGRLTDRNARERLARFMASFGEWIRVFSPDVSASTAAE